MQETAFTIRSIEAFHVVVRDKAYWGGLAQANRAQSDRYVLKSGWRAAYGKTFETAIVKVTLADGSVGWGEATEPICPEVICRLAVHLVAPFVGNQPFEHPADAWNAGYDLQRVRGHTAGYVLHALAAIDIAVWDALGKRNAMPLAQLLARDPARTIPAYLSGIRRGTLAERIDLLGGLVEKGLGAVKIFVSDDTAETLAEIDALRAGVPGDWNLMVDALWSYRTVEAAARARRAFGERDVRWFECPIIPEDFDGHVSLARCPGAPIALGEHFFTRYQSRSWFKAGALSIFQPDIGRTGLSDGLRQASIARKHGVSVTPHMGSGSPIVQASALQFWSAIKADWPCEFQFDLSDVLPGAIDTRWALEDGCFTLPTEAGLGVSVDETALRAQADGVEIWQAA
jgi:galactonate dehydratase